MHDFGWDVERQMSIVRRQSEEYYGLLKKWSEDNDMTDTKTPDPLPQMSWLTDPAYAQKLKDLVDLEHKQKMMEESDREWQMAALSNFSNRYIMDWKDVKDLREPVEDTTPDLNWGPCILTLILGFALGAWIF